MKYLLVVLVSLCHHISGLCSSLIPTNEWPRIATNLAKAKLEMDAVNFSFTFSVSATNFADLALRIATLDNTQFSTNSRLVRLLDRLYLENKGLRETAEARVHSNTETDDSRDVYQKILQKLKDRATKLTNAQLAIAGFHDDLVTMHRRLKEYSNLLDFLVRSGTTEDTSPSSLGNMRIDAASWVLPFSNYAEKIEGIRMILESP